MPKLINIFYNQFKKKVNTIETYDLSKGLFLMEFLNVENSNGAISKIDIIKDMFDPSFNSVNDGRGISIGNYISKNSNESEIYSGVSNFSEIKRIESKDENEEKFSALEVVDELNFSDITIKNILKEDTEKKELTISSLPQYCYQNNNDILYIKNSASKVISSNFEADGFEIDEETYGISESFPDENSINIIPSNNEAGVIINTLNLTETETLLSDVQLPEYTATTIELPDSNIVYQSISFNWDFSKKELKHLKDLLDVKKHYNDFIDWICTIDNGSTNHYIVSTIELPPEYIEIDIDNLVDNTNKIIFYFPNDYLTDISLFLNYFREDILNPRVYNNRRFTINYKKINDGEEKQSALGYIYSDSILAEEKKTINSLTLKNRAGTDIVLNKNSDKKLILKFNKNNLNIEEGILEYDSVLQLARNEIGDKEYTIEYEEKPELNNCKFQIFKNLKKIIIYVPELIEEMFKEV